MRSEQTRSYQAPRVDLLRHGSVVGGDCLRGWQDDPLNEHGWRQMRATVGEHARWQRIVSSPLRRCSAFAQSLAERDGITLETDPRWRELGFGDWEGRTVLDLQASEPQALQAFWDNPNDHPPPGGESLTSLQQRSAAAWDALCAALADGSRTLLVTHAGVIRVLLCRLLKMPIEQQFRFEIPHAALVSVIADPQWPQLYLGPALPAQPGTPDAH